MKRNDWLNPSDIAEREIARLHGALESAYADSGRAHEWACRMQEEMQHQARLAMDARQERDEARSKLARLETLLAERYNQAALNFKQPQVASALKEIMEAMR